jgi:hypothetical protein
MTPFNLKYGRSGRPDQLHSDLAREDPFAIPGSLEPVPRRDASMRGHCSLVRRRGLDRSAAYGSTVRALLFEASK